MILVLLMPQLNGVQGLKTTTIGVKVEDILLVVNKLSKRSNKKTIQPGAEIKLF
jgi:hypothetical protein